MNCLIIVTENAIPAHEEKDKSDNTKDGNDDTQSSENSRSPESWRQDSSKVIKASTTDLSSILARKRNTNFQNPKNSKLKMKTDYALDI